MFAIIQTHFIEYSPLQRTKALIEQIENLNKDVKAAFIPADFFASTAEMPLGKKPRSASAILFQEEKALSIKLIQEAMHKELSLVFCEEKSILILKKDKLEKHNINQEKTSIEIHNRAFTFSYNCLPDMGILKTSADFHIHYNKSSFYYGMQEANIAIFQEFAKSLSRKFIFLNPIGVCDGEIFHGQSFIINPAGQLEQSAEAFKIATHITDRKIVTPLYEDKYKLIFDALVFAIKEHIENAGLKKAILGLSGGIDSALVLSLAVEALGADNVTALLMPSPYSSDHSIKDAKDLAENLNVKYHIVPIEEPMKAYDILLNPLANIYQESEHHTELMKQNIQSRIRGMLLMGLANASNSFVLGTGNKSEIAMGYSTLYGDTCAGLFPIGDLYKYDVYALAKWYNEYKNAEIIPQNSINKAPSAELAPNQKDSDSLPEYPDLDSYLCKLIEEKNKAFEIEHSFTLTERNAVMKKMKYAEFKRKQCAPILKISHATYGFEWQ